MKNRNFIMNAGITCIAIGLMLCNANTGDAQPASPQSPDLQAVVALSKTRVPDDVISNYIKNSGKSYRLSAADIVYLNEQGVSKDVINALLQTAPTGGGAATQYSPPNVPPATTVSPAPIVTTALPVPIPAQVDVSAATVPTLEYFEAELAPYGNWVNVPGYGLCWQPVVEADWRPYYDGGHWVYTDVGWYWQSDYPWGDIAFHYGRWACINLDRWVWIPGYDYAPAWVLWRRADEAGYLGWAPLPPGVVFVNGGWILHGVAVGVDYDFGLGVECFTFVAYDHFWEHDFRPFSVPHDQLARIFGRSMIESRYRLEHGRFVNEGLARDRVAALTRRPISAVALSGYDDGGRPQSRTDAQFGPGPGHDPAGCPQSVQCDGRSGS